MCRHTTLSDESSIRSSTMGSGKFPADPAANVGTRPWKEKDCMTRLWQSIRSSQVFATLMPNQRLQEIYLTCM